MSLQLRPLSLNLNSKQIDSKQKKYHQAVEKALQHFDTVTEWADYISSLGKLLKALQSWAPKFQNIKYYVPYPYEVARRLASSLSPNLPSGVHQKTLEVYSYVFEKIGPETLGQEVNIWIVGILPLMSYASISVKHNLIEVYEKYIVSLSSVTLKIIVKPVLASLFPGIDDESSESQASTMNLIETLYTNLNDPSLFWQSCFIIIINNKERRLGGLVWLTKKLPSLNAVPHLTAKDRESSKLSDMDSKQIKEHAMSLLLDAAKPVISPEPGLLIRSFIKCLEEENEILIQRGILDLLLQRVHLHSPLLQMLVKPPDCRLLIMTACKTMLKKDMSLNRRIWNWLLGPALDSESGEHKDSDYFIKNGAVFLLDGLNEMIETPNGCINAYKIVLALMDRWQIGSYLTPKIFIPLMEKSRVYCSNAAVLKTASSFFDAVETNIIWGKLFDKVFVQKDYDLLIHVVQNFRCSTDEEITVRHLPLILLSLLCQIPTEVPNYTSILEMITVMIPERAYLPIHHSCLSQESKFSYQDTFEEIKKYYETVAEPFNLKDMESSNDLSPPLNSADLTFLITYRVHFLLIDAIRHYSQINEFAKLFVLFMEIIPQQVEESLNDKESRWSDTELLAAIFERQDMIEENPGLSLQGLVEIYTKYLLQELPILKSMKLLKIMIQGIWTLLLDHNKQIDGVEMLRAITRHVPQSKIESCLAFVYMKDDNIRHRLIVLDCIWQHLPDSIDILRRPLSLTLDELADEKNSNYWYVHEWLLSVVSRDGGKSIFAVLVSNIIQHDFITNQKIGSMDDLPVFAYHLDVLKNVLQNEDSPVYKTFEMQTVPQSFLGICKDDDVSSFKSLVISVLLKFLTLDNEQPGDSVKSALSLLSLLVNGTEPNFKGIVTRLLQISNQYISNKVPDSQVVVVSLLHTISQVLSLSEKRQIKLEIFSEDSSHVKYIDFLVTTVKFIDDDLVFSSYVTLLSESIVYFQESILKIILPLSTSIIEVVQRLFQEEQGRGRNLRSLSALIRSLEDLLQVSHGYLQADESSGYFSHTNTKNDFLQSMVSNVFSSDTSTAENRLMNERTVVLKTFNIVADVVSDIWNWADQNSTIDPTTTKEEKSYAQSLYAVSLSYKNVSSRLLEKLYTLEPSNVIENLIARDNSPAIIRLVRSLDNGRTGLTVSSLLQGVVVRCNETGSASLFGNHKNKKALIAMAENQVQLLDVLSFLFDYVDCLENSCIEEFYNDFLIFLKEVVSNYANYNVVGFPIVKVVTLISEKLDYSSLGQERRVRKEFSESFLKLLNNALNSDVFQFKEKDQVIETLCFTVERLSYAVNELSSGDKFTSALNSIVTFAVVPYSKRIHEVPSSVLNLIKLISPLAERVKLWKQLMSGFFSDAKCLQRLLIAAEDPWNFVFYQWSQYTDNKERLIPDLILSVTTKSNVISPFNAWSDSEVQSKFNNILRIAYLILISPSDQYYLHCQSVLDIVERFIFGEETLLQAASLILLRSSLLKYSQMHFADHWSMFFSGLQSSLLTIFEAIQIQQSVDSNAVLQVCKTLDLLLTLNIEEFSSTAEWIFVIDTVNSIYKKDPYVALVDEISQCKNLAMVTTVGVELNESSQLRVPLLANVHSIESYTALIPFFFNVSYNHYEAMYTLKDLDLQLCTYDVLHDISHQLL